MLISGIYGPEVWATPLTGPFPFLHVFLGPATTFRDLWIPIVLGGFLVAHVPACIENVYKARRAQNLPTLPLLLEWTPITIFSLGCMAWLGSPDSYILRDNHLVLFCLTMSLVFGRMTTKIILAHLTHQPFPYWTAMLVPLIGGTALVNLPIFGIAPVTAATELWYLKGYLIFAFVVYGHWAHLVITAICNYLDINCLTIPREKWQQNGGNGILMNGTNPAKKD
jgi:ethanolaminephosphotransferase